MLGRNLSFKRMLHPRHIICIFCLTTLIDFLLINMIPFVYSIQVDIKLNGNRSVSGLLRGFDQFMNIVLDETVEATSAGEKNELGMVVIRGNSVLNVEVLSAA